MKTRKQSSCPNHPNLVDQTALQPELEMTHSIY